MGVKLLAVATVMLMASAVLAIHISDMSSQYYAGHSAPIVVFGQTATPRDSHAVILDSQRMFTGAASSLSLTSFSRVLAHAFGITDFEGVKTAEGEALIAKAAAHTTEPRAQILFNLESVGKTTLDRFQLNALANPVTPHVALSLATPPVTPPAASLTVAASLATGSTPSEHGVVAASWKDAHGVAQSAYNPHKAADTFAQTFTLADHLAAHTDGKGVTLSFSSSESLAWAFAVNKKTADTHIIDGWTNNYCIALTDSATTIRSVSSSTLPALTFKVGDLEKQLTSFSTSLFNNMGTELKGFKVADRVVSFSYSPLKTSQVLENVKFNLKEKADVAFLSELQYVLDLPSKLKGLAALSEKLNDEHQDLIVVSFAGFTALLEKYGRESEQFRGALFLLNHVFPLISSEFASLFHSEVPAPLQSLVFLGSHQTVLEKSDPRPVENVLRANGVTDLAYFPNIYADVAQCQKLAAALKAVKFSTYCPSENHAAHTHMLVEAHAEAAHTDAAIAKPAAQQKFGGNTNPKKEQPIPAGYYTPKPADVQRYQIILWLSIVLAFVLFAAVYALANMSFKKDTMLYSSFNPNWEDRKRR